MLHKRADAAVAPFQNGTVLVSGGFEGLIQFTAKDSTLSSSEYFDGQQWKRGVELPRPMADHCMLIDSMENIFAIGGLHDGFYTNKTFMM